MRNNVDEKIKKMLNDDIYIPQKITNRIRTSLEEDRKGVYLTMKLNKVIAAMIGIIVIGTGAVFAGKVIIENMNSVEIAKEYGYFEKVDMDYVKDAGLGIKIENYFIDQGRVGVTINLQTEEEIDSAEIYSTNLTGSNSYSEIIDGKIYIYSDESETGIEYKSRWDLIKFIDENGNEIRYDEDTIGGRGPELGEYEVLSNNVVSTLYTKPIYQEVTASKMKVVIKRVITHKDGNEKEYIGNWEFEIDIADKYLNKSNSIKYNGTVNLENVVVEKAELSATKLIVRLKAENLQKLLYRTEDNREILYGFPRLFGEEGEYNHEEINTEQSNYYDKNEMVFKFDISKFNAENSYKILLDGGMEITLTK